MDPKLLEFIIYFKMLNSVLPLTTLAYWGLANALKAVAANQILVASTSGMAGAGMAAPAIIKGAGGKGFTWAGKSGPAFKTSARALKAQKALGMGSTVGRAVAPRLLTGALGFTGIGALALAASVGIPWYLQQREKAGGGYLSPMAQGGFPSSGAPYLVGEQGPELFVPEAAGQLLNNGATQNTIGNGMKLNNVTIGIDSFGGLV